jgi:hypothetical protein
MTNGLSSRSGIEKRVGALALTLFTIVFWLVIATFPSFFIFNPLETADLVFRVEQFISTIAWVSYASVPLLCVWFKTINSRSTRPLFLATIALWPLSILVIQCTMFSRGFGFYSYVISYPILAFTDILAPVALLAFSKLLFSKI